MELALQSKDITATLVCIGKFHLFALARELLKKDMLERIFSGYPSWKLQDEDIPPERLESFPWLQTPYMALGKWGMLGDGRFQRELAWHVHETLDRHVARHLPDSDVLFALSSSGLACGREAQKRGAKYICDRGSSHIRYQDAILREEFSRWGETFAGIDPRVIAKEESEYEAADLVTVPSTFVYRSFLKMGVPESKLRKVPYGADVRRFEKVTDPAPDTFDVLFVGQVAFQKGLPDLIEAFQLFKHPKKRLRIVGGMRPEMARYLKNHRVPDHVEFLGHIPQPELKHIMSQSHVMVLPSIQEGLALVQAQALACGCTVIGTSNTGAEDLFTDGKEGFIVSIRNPQAIADKLVLLADDPYRRAAMSEAALQLVKALGGWTEYGNQMAEVLRELVDGEDRISGKRPVVEK
ncbi:MAG: glycosyltransferase family 4 protein [Syntrophaceae bacterium]|nr:glycosyltransferase family 4 protein [Syntrophaceae bacterium]